MLLIHQELNLGHPAHSSSIIHKIIIRKKETFRKISTMVFCNNCNRTTRHSTEQYNDYDNVDHLINNENDRGITLHRCHYSVNLLSILADRNAYVTLETLWGYVKGIFI
jgi:hypothetical protein